MANITKYSRFGYEEIRMLANGEKELNKFMLDLKYREKVLLQIRKNEDRKYQKRIKDIEKEKDDFLKTRQSKIRNIEYSRWESLAYGKIKINKTEGKIIIENQMFLFSSVKGAEINIQTGFRMETREKLNSKKHPSIGGAIVGGAFAGPVGAVVGGVGFGKTKTKGKTVSNSIPTCTHIGVIVNIDGFPLEVTLISSQIDKNSTRYSSTVNEAQEIISKLRLISKTPVPQKFIRVEEEQAIKDIDKKIEEINDKLSFAISDKPTYSRPLIYKPEEYSNMSDQEYLEYLAEEDEKRKIESENIVNKDGVFKKIGKIFSRKTIEKSYGNDEIDCYMINCPKCENEISSFIDECPFCGFRIRDFLDGKISFDEVKSSKI